MPTTRAANFLRVIKPIAGVTLLGGIGFWIADNESLWTRIGIDSLAYSTLMSIAIIGLNAVVLRLSVEYYGGLLSYRDALRLSALGTLGNTVGGLPIGTTIKYTLLYKKSGLRVGEIAAGLAIFTLTGACWLLAYAAISAQIAPLATYIRFAAPLLLGFSIVVAIVLWRWANSRQKLGPLLKPFTQPRRFRQMALLSFTITTGFILNYLIVGTALRTDMPVSSIVFIASSGTLVSQISALQSVGGITELSLAFSSLFSGFDAITGATLAFLLRLTAIVAALAIVGGLYSVSPKKHK